VRGPGDELEHGPEPPSKSERKRQAHAAQELGVALIALRDTDLAALGLPEPLTDAIREARRIGSRGGSARQRQYIGKLMRTVELEPIRAALAARDVRTAQEAERFKRIEAWRDRLIAEGIPALEELERWRPGLDGNKWRHRVREAQAERSRPDSNAAARELFLALRSLFAGEP